MFFCTDRARPRLFILAGIPGCGKSTYARRIWPESVIVSTDQIRIEMAEGRKVPHSYDTAEMIYDVAKNKEVFRHFHNRLVKLLDPPFTWLSPLEPQPVAVADATNLTRQSRDDLINIANYNDAEAHLIFFANPARAYERNAKRQGNALVPSEAMEVMLKKWYESRTAILEEHYTSITIIQDII